MSVFVSFKITFLMKFRKRASRSHHQDKDDEENINFQLMVARWKSEIWVFTFVSPN